MPAKQKIAQDGGWGITYADISKALQEHEVQFNCTLEFSVYNYQKYKGATIRVWSVVCHARYRRDTPQEVRGWASCEVGHGSGAATFPGAYLRTLIQACDDLEKRRASPPMLQEVLKLPGFN
jgi:hypothetical protein